MTDKQRERLSMIPPKYKSTYRRAITGDSLRAAVNAQCLECVGFLSEEVRNCSDSGCPLYMVRPYRGSGSGQDGQENKPENTETEESVSGPKEEAAHA